MAKLKKYKIDELMFHAFCEGEGNILGIIDSYRNTVGFEDQINEWNNLYNQMHEYRMKRWGKTHTEKCMENCKLVSIQEIHQMVENGELKNNL